MILLHWKAALQNVSTFFFRFLVQHYLWNFSTSDKGNAQRIATVGFETVQFADENLMLGSKINWNEIRKQTFPFENQRFLQLNKARMLQALQSYVYIIFLFVLFCSKIQFDAMDEGFNVSINITETLKELQRLTRIDRRPKSSLERSRRLFGGDLQTAVTTLGRIRALFRKEKNSRQLVKESFTPFTETASNLLDEENLQTWEEVTEVTSRR